VEGGGWRRRGGEEVDPGMCECMWVCGWRLRIACAGVRESASGYMCIRELGERVRVCICLPECMFVYMYICLCLGTYLQMEHIATLPQRKCQHVLTLEVVVAGEREERVGREQMADCIRGSKERGIGGVGERGGGGRREEQEGRGATGRGGERCTAHANAKCVLHSGRVSCGRHVTRMHE